MSSSLSRKLVLLVLMGALAETLVAQVGSRVDNWTVPAYRAQSASGGLSTMTDISSGISFVAMQPCRVFDTRDPVGPYGGPRLIANTTRNFDIDSGPCGPIPSGVEAYSMNFGAILADGNGFITIWPAGAAQPLASSMNTIAGAVISNAAIVPSGSGGSISIFPNTGVHLYGDINGYFTDNQNTGNAFVQTGNIAGSGIGIFFNTANTNNSSGILALVGPGFSDNTGCCGPTAVIAKGAFNGVAGVAQDRGVVGLLASSTGGFLAEGQLGRTGGSDTVGYAVNGSNSANLTGADSAAVKGDNFAASGRVYGGRFYSASANTGAAGVIGFAAEGSFTGIGARNNAGVLGIASVHNGVKGIISSSAGEAVAGIEVDGAGNVLNQSFLGYSTATAIQAFGNISKSGTVSFEEPHTTDATKMVKYISLEGNEAGTYFRGRGQFQNGIATIDVPEDFRIVTQPEGLSIQVTPIGEMASVAVASIGLERIVVRGSRNVEFFYTVNGVRRGYGDFKPIVEVNKTYIPESADAKMPRAWDGEIRNRLIANGTYRQDGTVNTETARRLGWDRIWAEREQAGRPAPQVPPD